MSGYVKSYIVDVGGSIMTLGAANPTDAVASVMRRWDAEIDAALVGEPSPVIAEGERRQVTIALRLLDGGRR